MAYSVNKNTVSSLANKRRATRRKLAQQSLRIIPSSVLTGALFSLISIPAAAAPPIPLLPALLPGIIVVKPAHRPLKRAPKHRSYHYRNLPRGATFVVIAGITYAVIDNLYYRRSRDTYVYVEQPPVSAVAEQSTQSTATTETTAVNQSSSEIVEIDTSNRGKIVDVLPEEVTVVTIDGATFYVKGTDWYAPIAGTNQFVIVEPQF